MSSARALRALSPLVLLLASCGAKPAGDSDAVGDVAYARAMPFKAVPVATLDEPWALAFLPGGESALVTQRGGKLLLVSLSDGKAVTVPGTPLVDYQGQGGFGDVALSPGFATDRMVYLTWAEPGPRDTRGAALGRARLSEGPQPRLEGLEVIWRQTPMVTGSGHYGHRILFSPDGKYLFLSSGERQKFTPAQDLGVNLGKTLRLNLDGTPAPGNPFAAKGGVSAQIWSYGHRNPLGLAWDLTGRLWELEHGPAGGDELNLIEAGKNYGWPLVSNGDNYNGTPIPRNRTRPDLAQPAISWNPVIAPGNLIFYHGNRYAGWKGQAIISGLVEQGLVRVAIEGTKGREVARYDLGKRIRMVTEGPDGTLWLLEDGPGGRLLRLDPKP